MAVIYPGGTYRPLGPQTQPRMRAHEVICLHTEVGNLAGTDAYFRDQGFGGTESHFGVGGKWGADGPKGLDGVVWQWQDLDYTADANLQGNPRVISIETADNAPQRPEDIEAWTPAQVDAIIRLVAWLCTRYDIPARLVPDTRPGTRGIGYHAQGTAVTLPAGAERWSTTAGKPCPTSRRIAQINSVIIPGVRSLLAGQPLIADKPDPAPAPPREDPDMIVVQHKDGMAYLISPVGCVGISAAAMAAYEKARVPVTTGLSTEEIAAMRGPLGLVGLGTPVVSAAQQITGATAVGQKDYAGTVKTTLATVQRLVNMVTSQQTALAAGITNAQTAILAGVAAVPTAHLSTEDRQALAEEVRAVLDKAGMPVDKAALLDALAERLAA